MAADSCLIRARSSATVWRAEMSTAAGHLIGLCTRLTLHARMPLMRAVLQVSGTVSWRSGRRTLKVMVGHPRAAKWWTVSSFGGERAASHRYRQFRLSIYFWANNLCR